MKPSVSPLPVRWMAASAAMIALAVLVAGAQAAPGERPNLHPAFPLLDVGGHNVLDSGGPLSPSETCGECHDVEYIARHDSHAGAMVADLLLPSGEAAVRDPDSGRLVVLPSDLDALETNCLLCHVAGANYEVHRKALIDGEEEWAATATLAGSLTMTLAREGCPDLPVPTACRVKSVPVIREADRGFAWEPAAFDPQGQLRPEAVTIRTPTVEDCAACHGAAQSESGEPFAVEACQLDQPSTLTSGQAYSPQRISESGMNIAAKEDQTRAWDVHAERMLACTDCHASGNDPALALPRDDAPDHLRLDPRRIGTGDYLFRPNHELAGAQSSTALACTQCHDSSGGHAWLPHQDRHMVVLACETCHIPSTTLPSARTIDWSVVDADGGPVITCRGQGAANAGPDLIRGEAPALLRRVTSGGEAVIAPYNLVAASYWIDGDTGEPVSLADVQAAFLQDEDYRPDVLSTFDQNGNGALESEELIIDQSQEADLIAGRLATSGVASPRLQARVDAYPISHGVTGQGWAIQDCRVCHSEGSRLLQSVSLAGSLPAALSPDRLVGPAAVSGVVSTAPDGKLMFEPSIGAPGDSTYVVGVSRVGWIDRLGAGLFLGTLVAVVLHGGLRTVLVLRHRPTAQPTQRMYLYGVYERLWHWLQTSAILLLLLTGLIIHKPDVFAVFSFPGVVYVHNALAAILVANAALAAFYHLASGEIRQYLPRPYGFFDQAIVQAKFYLSGIFRREPHPFTKTPDRKLNPLQQAVYLGLLNVLLPLQIVTGALMWGVQRWPSVATALGGLPLLAPAHTLIAWMLAAFTVGHVYLTTTGPEPLASLKGMIHGWDDVELPGEAS